MKKSILFILTMLFLAPMLSGCFYYVDDWDGRGHGRDRGHYDGGRGYDGHRGGGGRR